MSLGSHQSTVGKSQVYLTPKWLIDRLGPFSTDPCAATIRPWNCAFQNYTELDDGLSQQWVGRVWLNPPFDRYQVEKWVQRLSLHGHGTLLTHARTETAWFRHVWRGARLILFPYDRMKFCNPDGSEHPANSGAPIVLAAFGEIDAEALLNSKIAGAYVTQWSSNAA